MKKLSGLRKRWILNTVGVVCALGLVCVLIITSAFAFSYYSNMEADMRYRAETTTEFFSEYLSLDYNQFYQSCISYAQNFEDKNTIELQFVDANGYIVASSYGRWAGRSPTTPEIMQAMNSRGAESYIGSDPVTNEKIMAVSCPMIYSNGDVIGVLRYVTSTRLLNAQVLKIGLLSVAVLIMVVFVVLVSSNYYIRSILVPMGEIIEKAKKIAGGTYGVQIQTKYNDEIGELVDTINELSVKINQNEKMQTEFISSLSHELRTPLTAINGWSETLVSDDSLNRETRRGISIILKETRRLTDMVVDLLDFTRIQDDRMTLNVDITDIRAEFEDTVFMYGSRLKQDGIELDYLENDEDIPEISCDCQRMRQVFLNILDNAAKHGGDGKRIEASIHYADNNVIVQIRDYGPGIPEDEIPLVKKKFYKGSSKARGTGIGLAVCDEIVQMHDGLLTLENASGGGTMVTVRLPAAQ